MALERSTKGGQRSVMAAMVVPKRVAGQCNAGFRSLAEWGEVKFKE